MVCNIQEEMNAVLEVLCHDQEISTCIDRTLQCPEPYVGTGDIHLIVLGQDPTVKNISSRCNIKKVLNLDKPGSLARYIAVIAEVLGSTAEQNIYATNIVKNFFIAPPAQYKNDILHRCALKWRPLLQRELELFPKAPVLALGEPVLNLLVSGSAPKKVREYWGYQQQTGEAKIEDFRYLSPADNVLNRTIFPLPHQPSMNKLFYKINLLNYLSFIRDVITAVGGVERAS